MISESDGRNGCDTTSAPCGSDQLRPKLEQKTKDRQNETHTAFTDENNERLRRFFQASLPVWRNYYNRADLYARIYQERQATALSFINDLGPLSASQALDLGCGPGLTTVELAQRGYVVFSIDFLHEMASETRTASAVMGVSEKVRTTVGDACCLPFRDSVFGLLVVLGVSEWTPSLKGLLEEASRVLKPGGHLIIAADNRWGLHMLLDPINLPLFRRFKRKIRLMFERIGYRVDPVPEGFVYSCNTFDTYLTNHRFLKLRARTAGFGPFTILRRKILSESVGLKLNAALQKLADRNVPLLRSAGRVYVVLARKVQ